MDVGIPPFWINIVLESNPPKPTMLVGGLAVHWSSPLWLDTFWTKTSRFASDILVGEIVAKSPNGDIYIYIYIYPSLSLSLSLSLYIYIYMCICTYIYIYIYMYTFTLILIIDSYIYIYIHILHYVCVYIYIYIYIYTSISYLYWFRPGFHQLNFKQTRNIFDVQHIRPISLLTLSLLTLLESNFPGKSRGNPYGPGNSTP